MIHFCQKIPPYSDFNSPEAYMKAARRQLPKSEIFRIIEANCQKSATAIPIPATSTLSNRFVSVSPPPQLNGSISIRPSTPTGVQIQAGSSLARKVQFSPELVPSLDTIVEPATKMTHLMKLVVTGDLKSIETALRRKSQKEVVSCLAKQNIRKDTALHIAIQKGAIPIALKLIELDKAAFGKITWRNTTVISLSKQNLEGRTPMLLAAYHGYYKVVEALLDAGVLDKADNHQVQTLHVVAMRRHYPLIKRIIALGGYTQIEDGFKCTPSDYGKMEWMAIKRIHLELKGSRASNAWHEVEGLNKAVKKVDYVPNRYQ